MNIWSTFLKSFKIYEDNCAIFYLEKGYTYADLIKLVNFNQKKIVESNTDITSIGVLTHRHFYCALGILSGLASGYPVTPLTYHYGLKQVGKIINKSNINTLLVDGLVQEAVNHILSKKKIKIIKLEEKYLEKSAESKCSNNVAFIMYTSGTTGEPKGVVLSHDNILLNLNDIREYFRIDKNDRFLIPRPLTHIAVLTGEFLFGLYSGASIVFYDDEFSPFRILKAIKEKKITVMGTTPTMFYNISLLKKSQDVSNLKQIVLSGEILQNQVYEKISEEFPNIHFYNVYGLTEASPRVSYLDPKYFKKKIGSVGVPLKSVKIKIVDKDENELPPNKRGELWVKGPNVMVGYYSNENLTKEKMKEGWLKTGDIAYIDKNGFLYIVGRKDEMIIRAGVNIYPQEIENKLLENRYIKQVVVWGERNPQKGQTIHAKFIINNKTDLSKNDIMNICKEKLEPYLFPDEIIIGKNIKRNPSCKVYRDERQRE